MNNRNLALKISKHPLIELLKKDKTIPKSVVARLIVEELMEAERQTLSNKLTKLLAQGKAEDREKIIVDFFKVLKTGQGYEKLFPTWQKMPEQKKQAFIEAGKKFDINKGRAKEFTKQIVAATTPQEIESGTEELIHDVEAQTGIDLENPNTQSGDSELLEDLAFYMGLAAAPISFVPGLGQAAGTALSIGSDLLTGADIIKDITDGNTKEATTKLMSIIGANIAAGLIPGGIAAKEGGEAAAKAAGKTAFAKTAGFLSKKLGKEISEKAVRAAVEKATRAGANLVGGKIGEVVSKKAQEHAEKINSDEDLKKSMFEKGQDILGNAWEGLKGMVGLGNPFKDLPGYKELNLQQDEEEIFVGLLKFLKNEGVLNEIRIKDFYKNIEDKETRSKLIKAAAGYMKTIRADREKAKILLKIYERDDIQSFILKNLKGIEQTTELEPEKEKEPSGEASTEPSGEPSATDTKPKPEETIQTSEDPKDYQDFVKASNDLINDFYRQKYKIQQARIVDAVIQSMKEFVNDEDKERSFQRTPDTTEETATLNEQEEKVEATEDQMRNIRIDIKSFLSRVNKTKEYLNQFEKVAKTGSVLGDAYKKRFIDNLKEIQLAVYRIAIILNKILGPKQELDEAKESETLKKWKEVQGKYDRAAKAVNSLKELVATETPPTEIDKDLISDAYDSLADLSQHFPSVSPFGKPQKGVEMDKVFEKYQLEFGAAIQAVKNSLQTSLNVMKLGEAGRESLQNARDGLRDFADEINRIFGVSSRFADAKVKPEDAKGEAVKGEAGVKDQESDETETDTEEEKTKEEITAEKAIHDFLKDLINKNLIILPKKEITEDLGTVALGLVGAGIIGKLWQNYETRFGGDKAVAYIFADLLSRFLNKNNYLNTGQNFKNNRSRIIQAMENFDSGKKQAIIKAYRKKFNEKPKLTGKKVQKIVNDYLKEKQSISSAEDKEETDDSLPDSDKLDLTPKEDEAIKDAAEEAVEKELEKDNYASEEEIVDAGTKETMSSPEVREVTAYMTDEEKEKVEDVVADTVEAEVEGPKEKEKTDNSKGVEILQQFFEYVKTEISNKEEQLKESYMDLVRAFTDDRRDTGTWEGGTTLFQNIGEYIESNYDQNLSEIIINKQPESSFWDKLVSKISTTSGSAISKIKSKTGKALAEMFLKWKGKRTQEKMKVFEAWKTESEQITEQIIGFLVDKTLGEKFDKKDAVIALDKKNTEKALEATKTILTKFIKALKNNSSEKEGQISESLIAGGMAALFTAGTLGAAKQLVGQSRQSFFDFQVKKLFLNTLAKYLEKSYGIKNASKIVFETWKGETLSDEEKTALIQNYRKPLFRSPKLTGETIQEIVDQIFNNKKEGNIEEKIANKLKPLIHEMLTKGK